MTSDKNRQRWCWAMILLIVAGCSAAEAERPGETSRGQDARAIDTAPTAGRADGPVDRATDSVDGSAEGSSGTDRDSELADLAAGTWHDEYQGKRTMVLRADGTGSMVVELSGLKAALFASRLEFDMVWSVENGRLNKRTVGGRPETRVKMILKMMGDRVSEPILELTKSRMLLLDADGETRYDWRAGD